MTRIIVKPVLGIALLLLGGCILLTACSEIGKQPPELWSARFTPDGGRMVYTYDINTIWQYERRGGSTRSSGTRKAYMDVRDAATGRSLLTEPYSSRNTLAIVDIIGDLCALNSHNFEKSRDELVLMDITTGKERFGPEELSKINDGLHFDPTTYFENTTGKPGFVFAADDARAYLIDPNTGKATLVQTDTQTHSRSGDENPTTIGPRGSGMSFVGQSRKELVINGRSSKVDFIEPAFGAELQDGKDERVPVIYQGNPIIISHSSTNDDFSWEISLLDAGTLDLIWSASVANIDRAAPFYWNEPLFKLNGEELVVQTSTQLIQFDAATGKLNWTVEVP